jgi:hypothetical protein
MKKKQIFWDNLPQINDYADKSGRSIKNIMDELRRSPQRAGGQRQ